ncbi:hypothetical protein NMY22_g15741 [Coprinellus aureogranulatus]|nr:hypothetical protein NMY22_g15741 [Coprinellus aureogranulatus]
MKIPFYYERLQVRKFQILKSGPSQVAEGVKKSKIREGMPLQGVSQWNALRLPQLTRGRRPHWEYGEAEVEGDGVGFSPLQMRFYLARLEIRDVGPRSFFLPRGEAEKRLPTSSLAVGCGRRGEEDHVNEPNDADDHRPRKRQRQDEEPDLLSFLVGQAALNRSVAPDEPLSSSARPSSAGRPSDRDLVLDAFRKELQQEVSCDICSELFYEPITTPCQHTYCTRCLQRSLDHQESCPQCRVKLPNYSYFQDHPINTTIHAIILKSFPDLYTDRRTSIQEEERDAQLDTPIFVCGLYFPGQRCMIHIFEPRYRLMLRRCLEGDKPWFGMVMPPKAGMPNTLCDYGTMLRIQGVDMLQDGRSVVRTIGTFRFRITDRGSLDGYTVGKIERYVRHSIPAMFIAKSCLPSLSFLLIRIEDYPDTLMDAIDTSSTNLAEPSPSSGPLQATASAPSPTSGGQAATLQATSAASSSSDKRSQPPSAPSPSASLPPSSHSHIPSASSSSMPPSPPPLLRAGSNPTNAELMDICRLFMTRLQRGTAPWVVRQLANGAGDMPLDNPAMFSFWVAALLPIDELEKAKLLPIRSARLRLLLVVHWIEQLNKQWYVRIIFFTGWLRWGLWWLFQSVVDIIVGVVSWMVGVGVAVGPVELDTASTRRVRREGEQALRAALLAATFPVFILVVYSGMHCSLTTSDSLAFSVSFYVDSNFAVLPHQHSPPSYLLQPRFASLRKTPSQDRSISLVIRASIGITGETFPPRFPIEHREVFLSITAPHQVRRATPSSLPSSFSQIVFFGFLCRISLCAISSHIFCTAPVRRTFTHDCVPSRSFFPTHPQYPSPFSLLIASVVSTASTAPV